MPHGWSKPRDLAKLAESRARFEFEIPLGDLPGIPDDFAHAAGPVHVEIQFGRERGVAVADVSVQAQLQLQCQRCLAPMQLAIAQGSHVALVESEAAAAQLPEELESALAPDGQCSLAALAAEELLLALPLVPRHAEGERCAAAPLPGAAPPEAAAAHDETQRPFADLRALLGRDKT